MMLRTMIQCMEIAPESLFSLSTDRVITEYDSYNEFVNMAINPTGNITSYTSNYNDLDTELVKLLEAAMLYAE